MEKKKLVIIENPSTCVFVTSFITVAMQVLNVYRYSFMNLVGFRWFCMSSGKSLGIVRAMKCLSDRATVSYKNGLLILNNRNPFDCCPVVNNFIKSIYNR